MDPEFSKALEACGNKGVEILVYNSIVKKNEIILEKSIPYRFND